MSFMYPRLRQSGVDFFRRLMLQAIAISVLIASSSVNPFTGPMIGAVAGSETESPLEQDEDSEEITLSRESLLSSRRQVGLDSPHHGVVVIVNADHSNRTSPEIATPAASPGNSRSLPIRC